MFSKWGSVFVWVLVTHKDRASCRSEVSTAKVGVDHPPTMAYRTARSRLILSDSLVRTTLIMDRSNVHAGFRFAIVVAMMMVATVEARADAIQGYTVTDLGVGEARLAKDASGNGVVIAPDGIMNYAFPRLGTGHGVDPRALAGSLPALTNAPVWDTMTYGNPKYAYSYFLPQGAFLDNHGDFIGTDNVGVSGHSASASSAVLFSERKSDGTFAPLTTLWGSPSNLDTYGQIAQVLSINRNDQLLGATNHWGSSYLRDFLVYDLKSRSETMLSPYLGSWIPSAAIALDDQGRILMLADSQDGKSRHSLLLSPNGSTIKPMPAPEASTLVTLAVGCLGLILRYCRKPKNLSPAYPL